MQFIFSPIIGAASDRFGRRPVILLSNLGLGLDYMLMAVAPSLGWLFVGRLISGITSASYPTAGAYIADVTPPAERAGKFGMLGAAFGLGFIVGPAVGGLLGSIDLRLPFWVAAGLSLANTAYGFFILPESLPPERRKPFSLRNCACIRLHSGCCARIPELLGMASRAVRDGPGARVAAQHLRAVCRPALWLERNAGGPRAGADRRVRRVVVSMLLVKPLVHRLGERRAALFGLACGVGGFLCFRACAHGGDIPDRNRAAWRCGALPTRPSSP